MKDMWHDPAHTNMHSYIPVSTYMPLVHMPEDALFAQASHLCRHAFGNTVSLCAIINARSGRCEMDCHFCAQSRHYTSHAPIFPLLSHDTLYERLSLLTSFPIRRVGIVTSGGALSRQDVASVAHFLEKACSQNFWKGRLCASLGRLSREDLERLRGAGLSRFHHNLECNENFYPHICSTQQWRERYDTAQRVQRTNVALCCGGIFGLGETWGDRIALALTLKGMNVTDVPINFLHPQAGTPLGNRKPLSAGEALRIIAIFRHILPHASLRVCGGARLVLQERRAHIFAAGANALMVGDYLTTQGKSIEDDMLMIEALGLEIVTT